MLPEMLDNFFKCTIDSLKIVVHEIADLEMVQAEGTNTVGERLLVIFGIVGMDIGQIVYEIDFNLARKIAENLDAESTDSERDLYNCLIEFANMVSGKGTIQINNSFSAENLRLTPPTIFIGNNLEFTVIKVVSRSETFKTPFGLIKIEAAFSEKR